MTLQEQVSACVGCGAKHRICSAEADRTGLIWPWSVDGYVPDLSCPFCGSAIQAGSPVDIDSCAYCGAVSPPRIEPTKVRSVRRRHHKKRVEVGTSKSIFEGVGLVAAPRVDMHMEDLDIPSQATLCGREMSLSVSCDLYVQPFHEMSEQEWCS